MAVTFLHPEFSFVRLESYLNDTDINDDSFCKAPHLAFCLPVADQDDIAYQFFVEANTEAEADSLCDFGNNKIQIGLVSPDADHTDVSEWLVNYTTDLSFNLKPDRFRVGPKKLLYNWPFGVPAFEDFVGIGECFHFVIRVVTSLGTFYTRTNCFHRIGDDCFTSVIYYGSERNSYGFTYCGYYEDDQPADPGVSSCEATIKNFSNQSIINVPYTPAMKTLYGDVPTVEVYIYDIGSGKFIKSLVSVSLDNVPPTNISIDLGGPASGYVKIY